MPHVHPTNALLLNQHPYRFSDLMGWTNACHGHSFIFTDGTDPKRQPHQKTGPGSSSELQAGKPVKVLIVDDDPDFRRALVDILLDLSNANIHPEEAGNGAETLERLRDGKNRFQWIFLDLKMPGMNGVETFSRIREFNKAVGIIMMTSDLSSDVARLAVERGLKVFNKKTLPFDLFLKPGEDPP